MPTYSKKAAAFPLKPGDVMTRKQLHTRFGGQERGGISTPRGRPFIFVFTSKRGEAFGYEHAWELDIYHYTGAGQKGHMEFTHGNKALRDHVKDEKRVFLFEERPDGKQEFLGEVVLRSWRFMPQKDASGRKRNSNVFELARAGSEAARQPLTTPSASGLRYPDSD